MNSETANTQIFKYFGVALITIVLISSISSTFDELLNSIGYYVIVVWLSWQFAKIYRNFYDKQQVDPNKKVVLITGCDTGFGYELAKQLDAIGFTVFASCLNSDSSGAQNLQKNCSKRLKVFKLDVTNDDDVTNAYQYIKSNLGNNKFWALVNNAGIINFLPIEWGKEDIDLFTEPMDVNVFGQVRLVKAFLPLLRRCKDSRIVNVESLAGRLVLPGMTSYAMTKYAVRAFSDGLRNEIKHFGINVSVIEPSVYSTGMTDQNVFLNDFTTKWKEAPESVRNDYGSEMCDILHERINALLLTSKDNYQQVIDAMVDAVSNPSPHYYYYVYGFIEHLFVPFVTLLPPELRDILMIDKIYFFIMKLTKNKNRL